MATAREPQKDNGDSVETTRQRLKIFKAYLLGALHDATERRLTYRISQKSKKYVTLISLGIKNLGYKAWVYREGKNRQVYVVEFSKFWLKNIKLNSKRKKFDYVRGYFDTEGGISKSEKVRYYIYFAQKNLADLKKVKQILEENNIACGKTHNPSKLVDPNYWRFYIRKQSYLDFAKMVGSSHPEKYRYLRMKR
jgi:hypothetical protein